MAYCTQTDIEKVRAQAILAELTNGTGGVVNTAVLNDAISWADDQIDQACEALWGPMPFSPVPRTVRHWSVDLTLYRLAMSHPLGMDANLAFAGERVLKILDRIAEGKGSIPGISPTRAQVRRAPADAAPTFSTKRLDEEGNLLASGSLDDF